MNLEPFFFFLKVWCVNCENETLLESYYSDSCSFECEAEIPTGVPESDSSDCSIECFAEVLNHIPFLFR